MEGNERNETNCELQEANEAKHKFKLGRMHFLLGCGLREKRRSIDLRKRLLLPGARRPLHLKRVAAQRARIAIAFQRPGMDELSRLMLHRPERDQLESRMNIEPSLFPKLAERRRLFVFAGIDFALRKKPGPVILLRPERAAEMDQQKLEFAILTAIQEKTRADFIGFRHRSRDTSKPQLTATHVCRRIRRKRRARPCGGSLAAARAGGKKKV